MLYLVSYIQAYVATFARREEGQALAEYGLILGLIAVLAIAALTLMGTQVQRLLNEIATTLQGVTT